ncbi:MAG: hypothetical protein HYX53_13575 [Chloroflexi bacterium]|nr:hypothetical protein [Chloroflexota bacterium]
MDRAMLTLPADFLDRPPARPASRRRYVLAGALCGLVVAVFARIWMRTISDEHVFTVPGTTLILLVFSGMGACAGVAFAWRRLGSTRRLFVQRAVALVPYLLLGPFTLLFLPGFTLALVLGHRGWRRLVRRALFAVTTAALAFILLIMLSRGPLTAALYLGLAYALFLTNRIAIEPRARDAPTPAPHPPGPWSEAVA